MRPTRSWRKADREAQRGRGFCRGQRFLKRVSRTNMAAGECAGLPVNCCIFVIMRPTMYLDSPRKLVTPGKLVMADAGVPLHRLGKSLDTASPNAPARSDPRCPLRAKSPSRSRRWGAVPINLIPVFCPSSDPRTTSSWSPCCCATPPASSPRRPLDALPANRISSSDCSDHNTQRGPRNDHAA